MVAKKKWVNPTEVREGGRRIMQLPEYRQWDSMRRRCEVGGNHQTLYPTYHECTYHPEWSSFDIWVEWARQQIGFLNRDVRCEYWSLDKDVLVKGNKHYSPETCVFVPQIVNVFLTNSRAKRGRYPIGVCLHDKSAKTPMYTASVGVGDGNKFLGNFATPEIAFQAYKLAKEAYARELAIKYTDLVDPRVVDALNNYTVSIEE